MAYELAPLPYDYAALEPFIDAETMKLHHDKHHQAYINNVNAALAKHPELAAKSVDDLIKDLAIPEDIRGVVRNNGGGHSNHTAFWKLMGPQARPALAARLPATSPSRLPPTSATSTLSKRPSTRPPPSSSAPAGAGLFSREASSRSSPRRIRTRPSARASTPSSATTSGSTPTT
jgi:hypothetical protein